MWCCVQQRPKLGSCQPSPTTLQSRSLEKIYGVVNRSTARTRQCTLYQGGLNPDREGEVGTSSFSHFMVAFNHYAIPIVLTLWRH